MQSHEYGAFFSEIGDGGEGGSRRVTGPCPWKSLARPKSSSFTPDFGRRDVVRLQVPIDASEPITVGYCIGDLDRVAQYLVQRQTLLSQTVGKRLTLQVFHHQKVDALIMADVVEDTDVGMMQTRNGAAFSFGLFEAAQGFAASWAGRT